MDGIIRLYILLAIIHTVVCLRLFNTEDAFFWRRSDGKKCESFTIFMDACNQCVCSADGIPYCTKLICPKEDDTDSEEVRLKITKNNIKNRRYLRKKYKNKYRI